ncbi:prolipoprotein diacylglyceryl transferase family protein, partial [Georgenia sp.]
MSPSTRAEAPTVQRPRPAKPAGPRPTPTPPTPTPTPTDTAPRAEEGQRAPQAAVPDPADTPPATGPTSRPPTLARNLAEHPLAITDLRCSPLEDVDQQSLGVTYWFEAETSGDPYPMTVHLSGHRTGEAPGSAGKTSFTVTSTVDQVVPGSGRIAVTTRVPNVAPGEWEVTATPVRRAPEGAAAPWVEVRSPRLTRATTRGRTAFTAFVNNLAPGVFLGAWPTLVGTGFVLALVVQALLAGQFDLPPLRLFLLTVVASALGLIGAKGYYVLTHPGERRRLITAGMSVQGFVIVTLGTLLLGAWLLGLPLGPLLDVTAPGLLFAMAVGRLGCLLGGCCVGRPTTARWGVWSSDRRLGIRRIPVQIFESTFSAVLGALALAAVVLLPTSGSGLVLLA